LLEKAYAKLHGSYEHLKGGYFCEALVDFTGGCPEFLEMPGKSCQSANLLNILVNSQRLGSLLGCSIHEYLGAGANGLVASHAYTITNVQQIQEKSKSVPTNLIRIRNPHGNSTEWNGPWSDVKIPEIYAKELDLKVADDGEFWMTFEDFIQNFHSVQICHLYTKKQKTFEFHGQYDTNPSFEMILTEKGQVTICLMQKFARSLRDEKKEDFFIRFKVLSAGKKGSYTEVTNRRSVTLREEFTPGRHLIIPESNGGEFYLRIISKVRFQAISIGKS
jgi:hypothetical protein